MILLIFFNLNANRVLDIEKKNSKEAYKLLPHPTFIYTVKFHPESLDILCTGGYDKVIRVWSISNKRKKSSRYGELLQEIFAHSGYINSLCFSFNGLILYSADSAGVIKSWNCFNKEDHSLNHKGSYSIFLTKL
jgi:jouberin